MYTLIVYDFLLIFCIYNSLANVTRQTFSPVCIRGKLFKFKEIKGKFKEIIIQVPL